MNRWQALLIWGCIEHDQCKTFLSRRSCIYDDEGSIHQMSVAIEVSTNVSKFVCKERVIGMFRHHGFCNLKVISASYPILPVLRELQPRLCASWILVEQSFWHQLGR